MLYGMIGVPFSYNSALRKFDFRGRWSATPKNQGRSKKTGTVVWQHSVATFKEAVPPPPPPPPPWIKDKSQSLSPGAEV